MKFIKPSRKVVALLFVALLLGALVFALTGAYKRADAVTNGIASRMMTEIGKIVIQRTTTILQSTETQLKTDAVLTQYTNGTALPDAHTYWLPLFWKQLELNPQVSAIYIADTQGNFIKADRLPRWATRVLDTRSGTPLEKRVYRQADYSALAHTETPIQYDPRTRPWYASAKDGKPGTVYWSGIYRFASIDAVGITASIPFFDTQNKLAGVLAADITLQGLSDFLSEQAFGDHDVALIINAQQELVAYPTRLGLDAAATAAQQAGRLPTLAMLDPEQAWVNEAYQRQTQGQQAQPFAFNGDSYIPVVMDFPNQPAGWKLLVVAPEDDLLAGANRSIAENLTLSLFALLLFGFILYVTFGRAFNRKDNAA
ncbi:MAG: cache domain-containing protein [Thiothrix sp.]|uniref:cache domain-containing protein n=1 Tax=Thiothrix sp. TaxID=1032 RepID=UPI0026243327|nr:cache domain-containing protein [Thiothrix sp.]MDD5391981.1 cache domain-containing protein [Thiothrix sp.]